MVLLRQEEGWAVVVPGGEAGKRVLADKTLTMHVMSKHVLVQREVWMLVMVCVANVNAMMMQASFDNTTGRHDGNVLQSDPARCKERGDVHAPHVHPPAQRMPS